MSHIEVVDDHECTKFEPSINGFEGVEKRLEVAFNPYTSSKSNKGLRSLSRQKLHYLLKHVGCTIVSELHNNVFDSYVLSESSLFIYPFRIILKTCGKTQILKCISVLLNFAFKLYLEPCFCKYSHATFLFPLDQPFPYTNFKEEVKYLDVFFGHMTSKAYIMVGDQQNWHIYSASTHNYTQSSLFNPIYMLEMCMTSLDKGFLKHFLNPVGTKRGVDMTRDSGIANILPSKSLISDYAFSPCGYSMNSMDEGGGLSTIHITPEESHSYASFEVLVYNPHSINIQELVDGVLSCFKPQNVSISIDVSYYMKCRDINVSYEGDSWGLRVPPKGYGCRSSNREEMLGEYVVTFHSFRRNNESLDSINPMSSLPLGITFPNSELVEKVMLLDYASDSDHDPRSLENEQ